MKVSFKNLKTSIKILVLSLSLTILLLAMTGYGVYLLSSNKHVVVEMESEVVHDMDNLRAFRSEAQDILANLLSLLWS